MKVEISATMSPLSKISLPRKAARPLLLALVLAGSVLPVPVFAQEGVLLRNILGNIGILPEEKDPIEYRERGPLVVPKDTNALRLPEDANAHMRNSAWPTDPDLVERKRAAERRKSDLLIGFNRNRDEAKQLSVDEMARGRPPRNAKAEPPEPVFSDKDGVRLNAQEWARMQQQANVNSNPTYPPGTEPPRRYLTEPPKGLRVASPDAPFKKTSDGPAEWWQDSLSPRRIDTRTGR